MKFWLAFARLIYRKGEKSMMKRIWATVWATCMALTAALALAQTSEEIALAAYPSCTVKASASGNGFDAFALGNGEKTALCIVENGTEKAASAYNGK